MVVDDVVQQYGHLSTQRITAATKRTAPFKIASRYDLLHMSTVAPMHHTTPQDYEAFERDLHEEGVLSLEEVRQRYGL